MPVTTTPSNNSLSDFDYVLPPDRIAKYPLPNRDHSRLLVLNRKENLIGHHTFLNFPNFVTPGDLVIFNNAKVIPARLHGYREGHTGRVELFLMYPQNTEKSQWQVLMRPARRLKPGTKVLFKETDVTATILEQFDGGKGLIQLNFPPELSIDELISKIGTMPIPPYLEREPESLDTERYQTIYAKVSGAQAAPTAGLHFTQTILDQLQTQGVGTAEITLNVSAGTFRPVLTESITDHQMDPESYTISPQTADAIANTKAMGKRIVAVGTTVAKALETSALLNHGCVKAESAWSDLFITPGFHFQVTDALLTNFHLPKSTLLMLVSAFANRALILKAYQSAIENQYRFYSYGDCMLII